MSRVHSLSGTCDLLCSHWYLHLAGETARRTVLIMNLMHRGEHDDEKESLTLPYISLQETRGPVAPSGGPPANEMEIRTYVP